jgi:GNAT superfamily N-acetyltransferase
MLIVEPLTTESVHQTELLYRQFSAVAKEAYNWDVTPVPFETFRQHIVEQKLSGYQVLDSVTHESIGLALLRFELHGAVEINLIHTEAPQHKVFLDVLIPWLIADLKQRDDWEVISYAMLGKQAAFIRNILWYGFKAVGQCIVEFDMLNTLSIQILGQQPAVLEAGYSIVPWHPAYASGVIDCIVQCFSGAADALWDPRFRTHEGAQQVLNLMLSGQIGTLLPDCTQILLKEGIPMGFCFLLKTDMTKANIPLIGIHPLANGKGLGKLVLKKTLEAVISGLLAETNTILSINATTDTANNQAIRMYRRLGFTETDHYPHVYLTKAAALAFEPGKWC